MKDLQATNLKMTSLLRSLATREGMLATLLDSIKIARADRSIPRVAVMYEPSIVIVCQGRKRGYLADQVYTYDPHNYLVLSVPLPFECETEASPEYPMLAVYVRIDLAILADLMMKMDSSPFSAQVSMPQGIYSTQLDEKLSECTVRLLECLSNPIEAKILGPQIVREITYRVLCGQQGGALRAAAAIHTRFGQVSRALQRIHTEYAQNLSIEALAETAGMSPSAFHQNFRAVTSNSPLQYLKTVRLHKARMLMAQDGLRAGIAAERVGYESASQFSREFKRLFGMSPVEEIIRVRAIFGLPDLS